jgi:hypothetical protein
MISAISSRGEHYFSLANGPVLGEVFKQFFEQLSDELASFDSDWRFNIYILCDNAPIHHVKVVQKFVKDKNVPLMFSGVASCDSAPVELLFSIIKRYYTKGCEHRLILKANKMYP